MRRYSKRNCAVAILLLIGGLYFVSRADFLVGSSEQIKTTTQQVDLTLGPSQRFLIKDSWVEQGDYLPLNVSYQLLAGAPPTKQRFLTLGLSSVRRKKDSYLVQTLRSLFTQSSAKERSSIVVVVLLAEFDPSWIRTTVDEIKTTFPSELAEGQLLVLHVPQECYPALTGLKRNYNDPPDRVTFRSKQNVDYSFLIHYCTSLGQYYLQLEDDISSSQNFVTVIKNRIAEQNAKSTNWAMLEFSNLGYIGKLYKSSHLPLLARFLFLFYQEMPCDWLMSHFRVLLTQKETIIFKPSLFQHMGMFSSFQGNYNKLKDKDFEEGPYYNPAADVYTDMSIYKDHNPELAWAAGEGFFWGRSPESGNHLTVVFKAPTAVTGVAVETGSAGKDILNSGLVSLGHNVITLEKSERTCQVFQPLGNLEKGTFVMQDIDKKYNVASSCLRIQVTAPQEDWVVIKKIRITSKS